MATNLNEFYKPDVESSYTDRDKDRVMSYLLAVGASYPSELAEHLLINYDKINAILIQMESKKIIKRMVPDKLYPQPLIKCRIAQMWGKGISGHFEFLKRSWFIATERGFLEFQEKHQGEGRQAQIAYLETYPNLKAIYDSVPSGPPSN